MVYAYYKPSQKTDLGRSRYGGTTISGWTLFKLEPDQLFALGRYPEIVKARSLLCYWAIRELGVTATALV